MRLPQLLACIAVLAAAVAARADEGAIAAVEDMLRNADVAGAADALARQEMQAELAAKPAALRRVCGAAAEAAERLAAADGPRAGEMIESLVGTATAAQKSNGMDPDAYWALAHARFARGRVTRKRGSAPAPDDWTSAADLLLKCPDAKKDQGAAHAATLAILKDAPYDDRNGRAAVNARLGAVSAAASAAHSGARELLLDLAKTDFEFAGRVLEEKKADAKELLAGCFSCLEPLLGDASRESPVANLYFHAVTLQLNQGMTLKRKYLMTSGADLGGALVYEVPLANSWEVRDRTDRAGNRICQLGADGKVLRSVVFGSYSFAIMYVFSDGTRVGGDNVKNLAALALEESDAYFGTVRSREKPKKGQVNRKNVGYTTLVEGLDSDGVSLRVRHYLFRGKNQRTYRVTMFDYAQEDRLDPSMEAFLESIREVED